MFHDVKKYSALFTLIIAVGDRARAELNALTADFVPIVGEAWMLPKNDENLVIRHIR